MSTRNRAVPAAERRAQILKRIEKSGGVTLGEIVRLHSVAPLTAHRDLESLAHDGLIERVRGGARARRSSRGQAVHSTAWQHRIGQAPEAKSAMARYVAATVAPGSTLFLDSSSTALAVADALMHDPPFSLTVVTNSPMIAAGACGDPVHVVVCPGELDHAMRAITGRWTADFIARLRLDTAFVSGAGLTLEAGLTTSRQPISDVLNAARSAAARTVALVDSTKFGRASLVSIAPAADFDLIVTDAQLPEDTEAAFRAAGVSLVLAS